MRRVPDRRRQWRPALLSKHADFLFKALTVALERMLAETANPLVCAQLNFSSLEEVDLEDISNPRRPLTASEVEEIRQASKLPSGPATPKRHRDAARKRSAARRADLARREAPGRREFAAAALNVMLWKDAVSRSSGQDQFGPIFSETIEILSERYNPEEVTLFVRQLRDHALEVHETEKASE